MNLGAGLQAADGVAAVLRDEEDDAVDPHLERIKNLNEESDEEVQHKPNQMDRKCHLNYGCLLFGK